MKQCDDYMCLANVDGCCYAEECKGAIRCIDRPGSRKKDDAQGRYETALTMFDKLFSSAFIDDDIEE